MNYRKITLIATGFLLPGMANAQNLIATDEAFFILSAFILAIALLILAVAVVVLKVLKLLLYDEMARNAAARGEELVREESWWKKFVTKANDAVPVEEEEAIILSHDYDGIRELDNHLPPWWKWLFYLTIIFAVVYLFSYHVLDTMPLQTEEYQAEIEAAEQARLARLADQPELQIDETNVMMVEDEAMLAKGRQIFQLNCVQCHAEDGGGGIGPNLTDEYWLHGGSLQDVFVTIRDGVPDKGMISWDPLFSSEQIQNVTSYVMTLQAVEPANPKEPQGERYVPESTQQDGEATETDSTQVAQVE